VLLGAGVARALSAKKARTCSALVAAVASMLLECLLLRLSCLCLRFLLECLCDL